MMKSSGFLLHPRLVQASVYLFALGTLLVGNVKVFAETKTDTVTNPNAQAIDILKSASDFLAKQSFFEVKATVIDDEVQSTGEKLQFERHVQAALVRPAHQFKLEGVGPRFDKSFWYNGKTYTLVNRYKEFYAVAPASPVIDTALDDLVLKYGVQVPLIDLLYTDPYTGSVPKIQSSRYYGIEKIGDYDCHHLFFSQKNIDWQLWVESANKPFIRKLLITYKLEPASPQYSALFTNWDVTTPIPEKRFTIDLPQSFHKIDILPTN